MHKLNWDDLRIFLAVARTGRFAAAASRLGIDHTTVARRIGALEGALGTTLIARSPHGAELTTSGKKLLEYAERMESDAIRACESLDETASQISGTVRLATPEAFGSWLVAPNV
ncbi:MAG: LysR family transcriptional regulator, partial [Gammaproteobacteria bacterium]|nr:LysR family transcriptional regulator [Gammaproteobacteria bacterium]